MSANQLISGNLFTNTFNYVVGAESSVTRISPERSVTYALDLRGRISNIDSGNIRAEFNYDLANRLDSILYENGVTTEFDYDNNGRLTVLLHSGPSGSIPVPPDTSQINLEKDIALAVITNITHHFDHVVLAFDYMHDTMQEQTTQLDSEAHQKSLEQTLTNFKKNRSPFKTFFKPTELLQTLTTLGLTVEDQQTAAELAKQYEVDREPYYTAKPYSVIACHKGIEKTLSHQLHL